MELWSPSVLETACTTVTDLDLWLRQAATFERRSLPVEQATVVLQNAFNEADGEEGCVIDLQRPPRMERLRPNLK